MAGTLELKSTFYFKGERLGMGLSEARFFQPKSTVAVLDTKESSSPKMNNMDVASEMSQVIIEGMGVELKKSMGSSCLKRLTTQINKSFEKDAYVLSLTSFGHKVEGFNFNAKHHFDENVNSKFCIKEGSHKGHMIVHIPAFVPSIDLKVSEAVSNFKVFARLIAVSDFEKVKEQYDMIKPNHHGNIGLFQTPMLPLLKIPTQPITTQLSIEPPVNIQQGMSTVLVIGFKFYTYEDKKFNRLEEQTMMKVFKVC